MRQPRSWEDALADVLTFLIGEQWWYAPEDDPDTVSVATEERHKPALTWRSGLARLFGRRAAPSTDAQDP